MGFLFENETFFIFIVYDFESFGGFFRGRRGRNYYLFLGGVVGSIGFCYLLLIDFFFVVILIFFVRVDLFCVLVFRILFFVIS